MGRGFEKDKALKTWRSVFMGGGELGGSWEGGVEFSRR